MKTRWHLTVSLSILMLNGVGADEPEKPILNVGGIEQSGGTITGVVKFEGKKVKRKTIKTLSADPICKKHHKGSRLYEERWIFGENDTLQNVFVYVSKGLEGKTFDAPKKNAVINQLGCVYLPHVSGVIVNQSIEILNNDKTTHNVNCKPKSNRGFNNVMVEGSKIQQRFSKPEMAVPLKCDVHPWMASYVHVMAHPYFAITQDKGTFTIKGLPAGDYKLSVWHEFKKFKPVEGTIDVSVGEGETKQVKFVYRPPARKNKK